MKFNSFVLTLSIILSAQYVYSLTEAQVKSTGKLVRNVCQPKSKATNAGIDNMHKGIWDDTDEKLQCYMNCVFGMMNAMKNNKFDASAALAQVDTLPARFQETSRRSIEACKDEGGSEKCGPGYYIGKCMYNADPENYFIP